MARREVIKVQTTFEQKDRDLICQTIGAEILKEIKAAEKTIKAKDYANITVGLADAGEWAMILLEVACGQITCVETLRDRVNRLDTAAREPWWPILETIEIDAAGK